MRLSEADLGQRQQPSRHSGLTDFLLLTLVRILCCYMEFWALRLLVTPRSTIEFGTDVSS